MPWVTDSDSDKEAVDMGCNHQQMKLSAQSTVGKIDDTRECGGIQLFLMHFRAHMSLHWAAGPAVPDFGLDLTIASRRIYED
ncbi:hypothetical protein AVEN_188578-1 [Araneus ventricosus]|uniref:Uncharacterized protein n=1 Tax=Araneus ventricosus TaxID=182803 RepID=A0A4Y2HQR2_ARAVE|nr:hypothetical protein AVEN_188578-1 [Araneus ventricosus]